MLDSIDFLGENVFLSFGALFMVIFIGWVWKPDEVLSEIEKNRVSAAIKQAKELDADFLGIGQKIGFFHPVRFQLSGIDWDSAFKNTPVYVTADISIDRSYDIINPAGVDGEST